MECEPLAQAALTVKFTPRRPKMVLRFMLTVEFIDWKMSADPSSAESCFSFMIWAASITGLADESLPKMIPTSFSRRYSGVTAASSNASLAAI